MCCLFHFFALSWWAMPKGFGDFMTTNKLANASVLENAQMKPLKLGRFPVLHSFLYSHIDISASQQYWDFFAPHSARVHQYLSVCNDIETIGQEIIGCKGKPSFSNLEGNFQRFETFGSHRSRLYRLTENLGKLEDERLLAAFAQYYLKQHNGDPANKTQAAVILHQFELHPELKDLPKPGYRSDRILWQGN